MYHEQNQLFLFTRNYLAHAMEVPGGLADYMSEFIVQFYYVPLYGALLAAFTLTLSQIFLGLACRRSTVPDVAYVLAALPSVLYVGAMGDENMLFSFAVAMTLTSLFIYLGSIPSGLSSLSSGFMLLVGFLILYWLAGPLAFIFIAACAIVRRRSAATPLLAAWLAVRAIHWIWLGQYSLSAVMLGVNYYRIPEVYPPMLFIMAGAVAAVPLVTLLRTGVRSAVAYAAASAVAVFAVIWVPASFNKDKSRILAYDSLVRQGRWSDIVERAREERPSDAFSLQALNLALGMRGELAETMFGYDQQGIEGLIGEGRLDNTTQLVTAEALYRLGLTNIAFSTTFDLQEAIMNDRKSGRHMKRLAECMIINGNYDVAAKYIGILSNSLFYSDWARQARKLLHNDAAVEAHPVYGPLRRTAFSKEGFYYHSQLDKILAMLVDDSAGANTLAWEYFCAAAMLKGDLATLAGVCNYHAGRYGLQRIPRHVQEAIAMYWTFSHSSFDGLPLPVSREVQQSTATLAQAVTANPANPAVWKNAAPGSYGVYFLNHSRQGTPAPVQKPDYTSTHE